METFLIGKYFQMLDVIKKFKFINLSTNLMIRPNKNVESKHQVSEISAYVAILLLNYLCKVFYASGALADCGAIPRTFVSLPIQCNLVTNCL
jgi:hypothetical protein